MVSLLKSNYFPWKLLTIIALTFLISPLLGAVELNVELDPTTLVVGSEITGVLTITHATNESIDPNSITLGTQPLPVAIIGKNAVQGNVKTLLSFSIPAQQAGIYLLPPLSINIGGKKYSTAISKAYTIVTTANSQTPLTTTPPSNTNSSTQQDDVWIKLETLIDGKQELYPGQKTTVGYRYKYKGNINLDYENIPLIKAEGFRKIGETMISERSNGFNIRQAMQKIEAVEPGEYHFPEGKVSGYAYSKKGKSSISIEAQSEALTITVKPLPDKDKPQSFNGAIGNFNKFSVRLLSLANVSAGDKVTLSMEIRGEDISDVPMPDLCCQPGFSGNFQQSDIPPIGVVKNGAKYFVVDIRPLSEDLKTIPSIEFSFFNPTDKRYHSLRSEPISIIIQSIDTYDNTFPDAEKQPQVETKWPKNPSSPPSMDTQVEKSVKGLDLNNLILGTIWVLLLFFILFLAFFYKKNTKKKEVLKNAEEETLGQQWLTKAFSQKEDPSEFYHSLEKAFIHLLFEKGWIASSDITAYQLPEEGSCREVRLFLSSIQEKLYSGSGHFAAESFMIRAQTLFDKINSSTTQRSL